MKCQNCNNEATTHIKQNINGKITELHLCGECAAKMGYDTVSGFENLGAFMNPFELISSVFAPGKAGLGTGKVKRCSGCGISFDEIAKTGRAGCPKCYEEFYSELMPSIRKIHGNAKHMGRLPKEAGSEAKAERTVAELKEKLAKAVEEQNFEEAARLRDEIKGLEA
ncbi:MAG: UvrB/UvrC motif-containing protein [Acutalibacteraceae bacterium]